MKIDLISIFPAYFQTLDISLIGKARESGLLDVAVHDLRDFSDNKHRTVDDTPYGGGAGMVMKPEPWARALDSIVCDESVLVIPTPSGKRFDQRIAEQLTSESHLVFACGRYEGIDERFIDYATRRCEVRELSLGDYVLNGGEVAALAIIEATVRLIPEFMGNPQSLVEESHGVDGRLEYPVFTKPASWRGFDVPGILLSGNHAQIDKWRREQSEFRTRERGLGRDG